MLEGKKVAIVHDWLVTYAGADRVVDQLHSLFPDAPIYTLVYDAARMPAHFRDYDIRTTFVQKLPGGVRLYKNLLTLMPRAFEQLDLSEYDVVISSCSSCSKGVITRPDAVHICYCHTPMRYAWSHYHTYIRHAGLLKRLLIPSMMHRVRQWDYLAAQRVDRFIANSRTVAQRIRKYYRRDAEVIYPGVAMHPLPALETGEDFYLMAGRFVHYKRFDLGVEACTRLGRRLIVAGGGEEAQRLRKLAGPTVTFVDNPTDEALQDLFRRAKALIFPGEEDFGIIPVEAQSAGCPVLALGKGGATETVCDGRTGLLFPEQTAKALEDCIARFEAEGVGYTRAQIREHARQFSTETFAQRMEAFCHKALDDFHGKEAAP